MSASSLRALARGGLKRSRALQGLSAAYPASFLSSPLSSTVPARAFGGSGDGNARVEKIGPVLATERGFAAENGQLPRRWIDEPVPPSSLSAMQEFPGIARPPPGRSLAPPRVQITTLSNGLRVATQDIYGQVATFAMFVDAGSMYEAPSEQGACHFLETTAFKSTSTRSSPQMLEYQMRYGIGTSAVFNREVVMYKVDTLRNNAARAVEILADALLNPLFTDEEMAGARQVIAYQRDEALSQPQVLVSEHLYAAAYGAHTPLGRPEKCEDGRVNLITADTLRSHMGKYFTAPRMVLAGVNIDHDVAVRAAEEFLGRVPASPTVAGAHTGRVRCAYVGGDVRSSPDWSAVPITAAAAQAASKTEFTHVMLALPTVGWSHDDVVPVCVVDTLLGGGSSFSAGGPGKGMYSRLFREVLNMNAWVESANAFSGQLYDSGIVGMYGAAPPEYAGDITSLLAGHFLRLCEQPVKQDELRRAANQLASAVLMNLETRGLLVEDIGRQILSHGKRLDPAELVKRIQGVTQDDIIRVMRTALSNPISFAAVGDVSRIASYDHMREYFEKQVAKWKSPAPGSAPLRTRVSAAAGKILSAAASTVSGGVGGGGTGVGGGKGAQ